jgi:hypothetical protein
VFSRNESVQGKIDSGERRYGIPMILVEKVMPTGKFSLDINVWFAVLISTRGCLCVEIACPTAPNQERKGVHASAISGLSIR